MHRDHDIFINAIGDKKKIQLTFFSNEDGDIEDRLFGPIFYSTSGEESDSDRYYLWDFESITDNHFLGLLTSQILRMKVTEEAFDPVKFFTPRREISNS
jgi:hypothetical protein